jgi:hypothetical protein
MTIQDDIEKIKNTICQNCGHGGYYHGHGPDTSKCHFSGCKCQSIKLSAEALNDIHKLISLTRGKCEVCNQDMGLPNGCVGEAIEWRGKQYKRYKYGEVDEPNDEDYPCHDCGVEVGGYHHKGCDCEQCPICSHQLLSCRHSKNGMYYYYGFDKQNSRRVKKRNKK